MTCSSMADVASEASAPAGSLLTFSNDAELESLRRDQFTSTVSHWLSGCTSLTAMDCTGLSQVTTVGAHWLSRCIRLTALDCTGLTQLATLGDWWLFGCAMLTALGCPWLPLDLGILGAPS